MKKLIALFFALALAFSAASCESMPFEEYCYFYGFAHIETLKSGAPSMSVIYLSEDHTCYFLTQMFSPDEPRLGRAYVGTWETLDDGKIFAKIGDNATLTLKLSSLGSLVDVDTMSVYSPVDVLMH